MAAYRAQVILHTTDAVPENYVSNSWAFEQSTVPLDTTGVTGLLEDFYSTIRGYLSPTIAQNGHEVKYTALPGSPPNYPFEEDTFNLSSPTSGTALPDEVAVCLSFQGARSAGFPQNRRRGRVYIGPLATTAATGNRPNSTFISLLASSALTFMSGIHGLTGAPYWSVWSPTDGAAVEITNGWIDNAFDTQRRRGVKSTSRTTFA